MKEDLGISTAGVERFLEADREDMDRVFADHDPHLFLARLARRLVDSGVLAAPGE